MFTLDITGNEIKQNRKERRVVLKDERRTLNIERPTSNEKQKPHIEDLKAISSNLPGYPGRRQN